MLTKGEYQVLAQQQKSNETSVRENFFLKTLEQFLKQHHKHITEKQASELVSKCRVHLSPLLISPAEIDLLLKIGVGSSSVVYAGKF